jgi:hypothetical protein
VTKRPGVPRPPGASRYGWFVGVVIVLFLAYVSINTLRTNDTQRSTGPAAGHKLAPFAAPLATGSLDGDTNVATRKTTGTAAGQRYACDVRGPQILNICQLAERGPVALAFLATRGGRCVNALDVLERLRGAYPKVQFAAVAIKGDRDGLRRTIRSHAWGFPVGYDRDGVLANLYGVAVCPQITLADRGGKIRQTLIGSGSTDEAHLRRALDALAESR